MHHIYNRINLAKSREQEVVGSSIPENMKDVLDKVMDYEPTGIIPYMSEHRSDNNELDDKGAMEEDEQDVGFRSVQLIKPCLLDLSRTGWDELEKANVKEIRKQTLDYLNWKRDTMKYIIGQVIEIKTNTRLVGICEENTMGETLMWSTYMCDLRPNYYV